MSQEGMIPGHLSVNIARKNMQGVVMFLKGGGPGLSELLSILRYQTSIWEALGLL